MRFFYHCRKSLATVVVAGMFLTACTATTPTHHDDGTPLTAAEIRIRERAASYNQTIAEGVLVGCIIGGLIGLLASGGDEGALAIGCGAGAVLGGGAGIAVAESKESYTEQEDQQRDMIAAAKQTNASLSADIADARSIIENDRARIDQIDRELAAGQISKQEASVKMQRVDDNIEVMTASVASLKKKRDEFSQLAQKDDKEMAREIATLEKQITLMEKEVASLITRRQVSRVG